MNRRQIITALVTAPLVATVPASPAFLPQVELLAGDCQLAESWRLLVSKVKKSNGLPWMINMKLLESWEYSLEEWRTAAEHHGLRVVDYFCDMTGQRRVILTSPDFTSDMYSKKFRETAHLP